MLKNNLSFVWNDNAKNAFLELRIRLANAPIFIYTDFNVSFLVDSEASDTGIRAVLSQISKNQLKHSIAYFSRTFEKQKRNYSITRNELLAAIEGIKHFRCYLYGRQFLKRRDHVAIQCLKTSKIRLLN